VRRLRPCGMKHGMDGNMVKAANRLSNKPRASNGKMSAVRDSPLACDFLPVLVLQPCCGSHIGVHKLWLVKMSLPEKLHTVFC